MANNSKQLAQALFKEIQTHGADGLDAVAEAFVAYLAEKHRLSNWREVVRALDQIWKEEYGVSNVEVVTAHELSQEIKQKIESKIQGADVKVKTDPSKIGGASIRIDDRIVDGTISTRLESLKQQLATS